MSDVIWHDIECGGYRQDLAAWLGLAGERGDPILDVGAGTGRVTLSLARAGYSVVALDRDRELLEELARRAGEVPVEVAVGDAREFRLEREFPLVVVPMQTIQLLGGAAGRAAFLICARRHLAPGGVVAVSIAEQFEEFEVEDGEIGPLADVDERDGVLYWSLPTAVRREGEAFVLERRRETVTAGGSWTATFDRTALDILSARTLEQEARTIGLRRVGVQRIAPTDEHVGSEVVILGA